MRMVRITLERWLYVTKGCYGECYRKKAIMGLERLEELVGGMHMFENGAHLSVLRMESKFRSWRYSKSISKRKQNLGSCSYIKKKWWQRMNINIADEFNCGCFIQMQCIIEILEIPMYFFSFPLSVSFILIN